MAYSTLTSDLSHPSNKPLLELVLSHVCRKHGLNKIDFKSTSTTADGDVTFYFKGLALPAKFEVPVDQMKRLLADSFRGPVIRSAVPDFSAAAQRMLMLLEQMQNPYSIRISRSEINNLIRE